MGVSKKTYRRHQKTWSFTTSAVDSLLKKEDPEHYFVRQSAKFESWNFLEKSRSHVKMRDGLNLQEFYLAISKQILFTASHWCDEAEAYMVANHKWHNITGDAERGLFATINGIDKGALEFSLSHSVYYGKYLELRGADAQDASMLNGAPMKAYPTAGYLGIIPQTIQEMSPQLTRDLQHIMDEM